MRFKITTGETIPGMYYGALLSSLGYKTIIEKDYDELELFIEIDCLNQLLKLDEYLKDENLVVSKKEGDNYDGEIWLYTGYFS